MQLHIYLVEKVYIVQVVYFEYQYNTSALNFFQ